RGAYLVINGGGHKNEDVTEGFAVFFEHDDLPKEIQKTLWKTLELPEPTFQVDTGGKSIHSYWVFKTPVEIEKWKELQKNLLEYADADRSIKNPARVMRLAGAHHISHDTDGNAIYKQTKIISASAKTYTYEELRGIIPEQEEKLPLVEATIGNRNDVNNFEDGSSLPRHPDEITVPVPAPVPLLQCCRKEVREWVATGVPKGCKRNDTAINVGLELIAVEQYLQTIGQSYSDSATSLFHEFCMRSGMTAKEETERYQWCQKTNSSPSCPPDAIESCIWGWYWKEVVQPQKRQNQILSEGRQQTATKENKEEKQPKINLLDAVKEIIKKLPQDSLRYMALINLAAQTGYKYREIELLARTIEREENLDEETAEGIASLSTNLNLYQQRLDITRYLEKDFAGLMIDAAEAMPTAPEYLFNTLLPVVASCAGTSSTVVANGTGGYEQPLIFWSGNVAHSGQAKTPPQQVIIKPLMDMEAEAADRYNLLKREYEQDKSGDLACPTRERFMMTNVTITTKMRIHGENTRGLLEYMDELSSDFRRLNQYKKGGVGDDKEQELSFFNGSSISYDRSDSRLFLDKTALSKTGTIQWDTLSKLMDNSGFIESGYMARFLLCSIGNAPKRYLDLFQETNAVPDLQHKLRWLYEQMRELPEKQYLLDHDAKVLFQAWNHTLVDFGIREYNHALSLVYPKIECYTLRLALWLHLVNSLLEGKQPHLVIDGATMKAAIEIGSFYLGQHRLIFTNTDSSNDLEGILLKIHTKALDVYQQTEKGVSASWAKKNFNALRKMSTDQIRSKYFQVLASNGYGKLEGVGKSMKYIPFEQRFGFSESNHPEVDESCEVSGNSMEISIGEMPIQTCFKQKVAKIDDLTYSKIIDNLLDNQSGYSENHQLINQSPSTIDEKSVTKVETPPQCENQPSNLETITNDQSPVISNKQFIVTNQQSEVGNICTLAESENENTELVTDIEWLMNVLEDLERDNSLHTAEEWLELLTEVEQKVLTIEGFNEQYPNYWTRIWAAFPDKETETETDSASTLDDLKSLLLACKTWVELKQLQKQHPEQTKAVYTALNPSQQVQLDAIAATEVNEDVFKYVGSQRKVDGVEIEPGTLVYLDPQSNNKNRLHLKVRLLQGINQGWQKVVEISRDALEAVEKAVNEGLDAIEGQQGNLLDGQS
ncbi:DUF3987 domain-containing protein, partial [Crocosphaera sp. Alani8]|uniref:DUF3987 domain-containing protein n=1 Tax=Crocosphaera sp. Alani8 TaxID=3038952 RepID=UPI00313EFD8B